MEKYSNEESHALQNVGITLLDGCIRDLNIKVPKTKKVKIIRQYLQFRLIQLHFPVYLQPLTSALRALRLHISAYLYLQE